MFDRLTDDAGNAVVLAQEEARGLCHSHVGPEHVLLALSENQEGIAGEILAQVGLTAEHIRDRVVSLVGMGDVVQTGAIPFTLSAKRLIVSALQEALGLGDGYIGAEHLLLALLSAPEEVPAGILNDAGLDLDALRIAIATL